MVTSMARMSMTDSVSSVRWSFGVCPSHVMQEVMFSTVRLSAFHAHMLKRTRLAPWRQKSTLHMQIRIVSNQIRVYLLQGPHNIFMGGAPVTTPPEMFLQSPFIGRVARKTSREIEATHTAAQLEIMQRALDAFCCAAAPV